MNPPPAYRRRLIDDELDELLKELPAIAIEGAKAVGKTATATQRARTVRQLDDRAQLEALAADPERLFDAEPPVLVDEWQHLPEIWDRVRRAVDRGLEPGRVLLTGSASPVPRGSHSGAGRIVSLRMRPLSLAERRPGIATISFAQLMAGASGSIAGSTDMSLADYVDEILLSGFPGLRHLGARALRAQLDGYLARIVDRDFPELGLRVRNPAGLRRWMTACAAASSTTASWEKLRDAAAAGHSDPPAKSTVIPYRDILERLWILDPVPGWKPGGSKLGRLALSPKHQFVDPALSARLLGASKQSLLAGESPGPDLPRDGTLLGALFESLVTQSVQVYCQSAEARLSHLRAFGGEREIDLIAERPDGRVMAIEVKLSATVGDEDVRHLKWLKGRLGENMIDAIVVTTGREAYRRPDGVAVIPAALLGP